MRQNGIVKDHFELETKREYLERTAGLVNTGFKQPMKTGTSIAEQTNKQEEVKFQK